MTRIKQPGRGWAYAGAIGGGAVSIAANIAHSFLLPERKMELEAEYRVEMRDLASRHLGRELSI